jgi:TonB-linked SusC/RagA family outer membrane protein
MRVNLTIALLVSAFMQLSYAGYAQKITINKAKAPLIAVLNDIEAQTGVDFIFTQEMLSDAKVVSIKVSGASLDEVLKKCFLNQPLTYTINKDVVVIKKLDIAAIADISLTGKVTDTNGDPLPGVTVQIKGTSNGAITATDGSYSINATDRNAVLIFKFLGMLQQEVNVGDKTVINIKMLPDVRNLNDVVVVGYGTQKKENLTGSVSTVSSKVFESRAATNVAQMLQGVVPGLTITQSGALAGSLENRPTINIRGVGTIGKGSNASPLILVDGMESDINGLNPQDIDNISVLKDAAASSIYGSRAPFGVILITTKSGKADKMAINFTTAYHVNTPILLPNEMDSYTFANYFNDARTNSGQGVYFSPERMQRIKDYQDGKITTSNIPRPGQPTIWGDGFLDANANVDWYKAIYKQYTPAQEYNLNVSGGKGKTTYYLSGGALLEKGFMNFGSDHLNRYNTTAKISTQLSDHASISYIGRFSREEFARPSTMTNTLNQNIARQGWPPEPLYVPNGFLYDSPSPALALRDGGKAFTQTDHINQQLKLTIEPIKGWKIFGDINYSIRDIFYHWDILQTFNHDVAGNPILDQTDSKVRDETSRTNYFNSNIYTEYSKTLGGHYFKVLVGAQAEQNQYQFFSAQRTGVIDPDLSSIDLTSGNDATGAVVPPSVAGNSYDWATSGYFGRANYSYKDRYLFEANIRYDGSSRFRENRRWVYSPSASAGWNISKEDFWQPFEKYVNMLKIRGSYGKLNNQNTTSAYPTYLTMPMGTANGAWLLNGQKTNTSYGPPIISSSLTWEKVKTLNTGIDLAAFKNRLSVSFDYYIRYTDDMIGPAPELPIILGTPVPNTNNTSLKTNGFDLSIDWHDRLQNGFGYNLGVVLSDAKTVITAYPNPTGALQTEDPTNTAYNAGHQMGEIWGYQTIGIAKTQNEMDAHLASLPNGGQNALGSNWQAGDLMFKDVNADGKISSGANTINDHGDLVLIGNFTPRYLIGINMGADWKGVDFRAFFQGVLKRDYFQNNYYFWGASSSIYSSVGLAPQANYFRNDPTSPLGLNIDSYYPRPLLNAKNQVVQSRYLQNAAYMRLKNLQVGYTIPLSLTSKIGIKRLRIYASGENVFTITKMAAMFDPETVDGGFNGSVYPLSKVYSLGVNVTL